MHYLGGWSVVLLGDCALLLLAAYSTLPLVCRLWARRFMKGVFPKVVIWDDQVTHHYTVWVHAGSRKVAMHCLDCNDLFEVPLRLWGGMVRSMESDEDLQVVAWVEDNG